MNAHAHSPSSSATGDRRFIAGIAVNVAFVAIETICGFAANSLGLLADAGHNAGDVLGLLLAWGAIWLGRRQPSGRFTYGLQSASIMAAVGNALLLAAAVAGIGWEALHRLTSPEMPAATLVIIVAAAGTAINGGTAWLFHAGHHDLNIRAVFLHMALDAALSLGVALAGLLMLATGWRWPDPAISLLICAIIIFSTWRLLKSSIALALHAVPAHIDAEAVRDYLAALPGVTAVHDLHIWAMSTTDTAMSAHLIMPGGHPGDSFLRQVTSEIAQRFRIAHATLQIEMGDETECHSGCAHA